MLSPNPSRASQRTITIAQDGRLHILQDCQRCVDFSFLLKLSITRVYVSQALTDLIAGDIPSFKLFESDKILAYLDIQPLSKGHAVRPP